MLPTPVSVQSGPDGCRTQPPGDPRGDQQCACHTRPKHRGSSPSSRSQGRVVGASPGRQEGQHGPLRSGPSQKALQPCSLAAPISGPQSTSGPLRELRLLCAATAPPTLPNLSFRPLPWGYLFQEASLMPQPDLSASSGPLRGPCLRHCGSDHPVV